MITFSTLFVVVGIHLLLQIHSTDSLSPQRLFQTPLRMFDTVKNHYVGVYFYILSFIVSKKLNVKLLELQSLVLSFVWSLSTTVSPVVSINSIVSRLIKFKICGFFLTLVSKIWGTLTFTSIFVSFRNGKLCFQFIRYDFPLSEGMTRLKIVFGMLKETITQKFHMSQIKEI